MKYQFLSFFFVCAACGNNGNENTSQPKTISGQSCEDQVADLNDWMTKIRDEGGHEWPVSEPETIDMVSLATSAREPSEHAAVMSLNRESVSVNGTAVVGEVVEVATLVKFLKVVKEANKGAPSGDVLGLAVDKLTPWSNVVAAVEAASQAGFPTVEFLFKNPPATRTLSPPAASSLTKEITAARTEVEKRMTATNPVEQRSSLLNETGDEKPNLLKKAAAECPALQSNFDETPNQEPAKRFEHMTDSVVAAVEQCDCKADIPALKEIYWYFVFGSQGEDRPYRSDSAYKGVVLAPVAPEASDAVVVTASGDEAWQEVYKKITGLPQTATPANVAFKAE